MFGCSWGQVQLCVGPLAGQWGDSQEKGMEKGLTCPLLLSAHSLWLEVLYVVHFGALNKERNHPLSSKDRGGAGKDDILSPFCRTLEVLCVCVLFPTSQGVRWLGMNSGTSQVIFLCCVIS